MANSSHIERKNAEGWAETPRNAIGQVLGAATPSSSGVLDASTVGIAIYDDKFRCVLINKTLASMYGRPAKTHTGKSIRQILGDDASQVESAFRRAWTTGKPVRDIEMTVRMPGRLRKNNFVLNLYPFGYDPGGDRFVVVLLYAITSKNRLRHRNQILSNNKRTKPAPGKNNLFRRESMEFSASRKPNPVVAVRSNANVQGQQAAHCLSQRELQVMHLLAEGNSNKEIAAILDLSTRTVEAYRARLMVKLHLHSIAELVRYAVRNNLVKA